MDIYEYGHWEGDTFVLNEPHTLPPTKEGEPGRVIERLTVNPPWWPFPPDVTRDDVVSVMLSAYKVHPRGKGDANEKPFFKVTTPVQLHIRADTEQEAAQAAYDALLDLAGHYPVWAVVTDEHLTHVAQTAMSNKESEDLQEWLARYAKD